MESKKRSPPAEFASKPRRGGENPRKKAQPERLGLGESCAAGT